ncbi:MAG: hypothetical protein LUE14_09555 [Clostridiales bacterium]|nr:hypothetical protein [Clostridiales bacterium]
MRNIRDYPDKLKKELGGQVAVWKDREDELQTTINEEKNHIEQFDKIIQSAMKDNAITTDTAVAKLNKERSAGILKEAEKALSEHRNTPLYTLQDYDTKCKEIQHIYSTAINAKREELAEMLRSARDMLKEMDDIKREGDQCIESVRSACRQTGTDINKEFAMSLCKPALVGRTVFPGLRDTQKDLETLIRDIIPK